MTEETPFAQAQPYFAGDARTNRERMLAGDWYVSDDPDNARIAAHARRELLPKIGRASCRERV